MSLTPSQLAAGIRIRHIPSQVVYVVRSLGKLRLPPDGPWLLAARYDNGNGQEYYRALSDFTNFDLLGE